MSESTEETPAQNEAEKPQDEQGEDRTFTQADLDRIVQDRLSKERRKYEGFESYKQQAEELAKIKDSEKSEVERLQEQLEQNNNELSTSRLDLARYKALAAHPVSEENQDMVTGTTEEEFMESAKRISLLESKANDDGRRKRQPVDGIEKQIPNTNPSLDEQILQAQNDSDWQLAGQLKAQKLGAVK